MVAVEDDGIPDAEGELVAAASLESDDVASQKRRRCRSGTGRRAQPTMSILTGPVRSSPRGTWRCALSCCGYYPP